MPRKKREWYPGAIYHVMNRGNRRTDLFFCDHDYEMYLKYLEVSVKRFGLKLLGYCLMTNHVHLQIETSDVPLWFPLQYVNLNYTKYFNKKYNYVGHLFQGRYTSVCIEDDAQLLQTSRYIHLNPVKANMTRTPDVYRWSSCAVYYDQITDSMVHTEKILRMFQPYSAQQYKAFVEAVEVRGECATVPDNETEPSRL